MENATEAPRDDTVVMSRRHYHKIIWTLAFTMLAIGCFGTMGAINIMYAHGVGVDGQTNLPMWLNWVAFLGLPVAGRVILAQSLRGY